ncbi:hypothetical protein Q5P01_000625 [Channa striata]|uniref:Uncharacterized protein n=1 Tax=Channa striata TaxID=64152 RepID=A0AA88LFR9_CHASR|nr:hypothetical protein Q5P01_000625 [Channa striata]
MARDDRKLEHAMAHHVAACVRLDQRPYSSSMQPADDAYEQLETLITMRQANTVRCSCFARPESPILRLLVARLVEHYVTHRGQAAQVIRLCRRECTRTADGLPAAPPPYPLGAGCLPSAKYRMLLGMMESGGADSLLSRASGRWRSESRPPRRCRLCFALYVVRETPTKAGQSAVRYVTPNVVASLRHVVVCREREAAAMTSWPAPWETGSPERTFNTMKLRARRRVQLKAPRCARSVADHRWYAAAEYHQDRTRIAGSAETPPATT